MFDPGTPKWEKSQTWWHTFQAGGSTCVFQSNQDDIHLIKKKKVEKENHLLQAILRLPQIP